jgi:hypothetical protein
MGQRVWKVPWIAASAALLLAASMAALAQGPAPSKELPPADLPVTRVVLFTTGVGYFEHSGTVTGTQQLDLPVQAAHMDDLLQSLVVEDLDGGTVRPVRYPSQDPLGRILASYPLDLSGNPSLAGLLAQARGERVHLEAGTALDGTLVNVEQVAASDGPPTTFLTLLTATGLRRIDLAEVRDVRFDDAKVQDGLQAALTTIARHRGSTGERVRLVFSGQGTRRVRVGYVREMPVWKTSYRLVLHAGGTADLQGWAIVDNPTDLDLAGVQMSFVAGRPLSFIADLYQPIYLQRPHVAPDLAQGIVPPATTGQRAAAAKSADNAAAPRAAESVMGGLAQAAPAPQLAGAGVEAMAQGSAAGATFQYTVSQPVTVARHESAMIPIVLTSVPARQLSVYDPAVLTGHPLHAVRLTNDTGLHLAAGPVTVFDDAGFTGDARMTDVVPGDARLLSYAVDLGVEVSSESAGQPQRVSAVTLDHGTLRTTTKQRFTTTYTLTGRGSDARFVVVEHPKRSGYTLVSPSPAPPETAQSYRLGVALRAQDGSAPEDDPAVPTYARCDAGSSCKIDVVLERTVHSSIAVTNVSSDEIASYLANVELSAADRATLTKILGLKRRIADLDRRARDHQAQIDAIFQDQNRIRQNMAALDRASSLYKRYATDLADQENLLQSLRSELQDLQTQRSGLQGQLDDLLTSLGTGA